VGAPPPAGVGLSTRDGTADGRLTPVTVVETILVYVVAPLAVVALFWALTFLPGGRQKKLRYKPGQSWDHEPVWFEPHPEHGPEAGGHDGGPQAIGSSVYQEPDRAALTSGHSAMGHGGTTHGTGHGATTATGQRPVSGGPLGGARGTW
jgi:hypothetical protein